MFHARKLRALLHGRRYPECPIPNQGNVGRFIPSRSSHVLPRNARLQPLHQFTTLSETTGTPTNAMPPSSTPLTSSTSSVSTAPVIQRNFDTNRYVDMMVKEEFSHQQADAIIGLVTEAIQER